MFDSIVVPLDNTPSAAAALPAVRTIVRATNASVELVRVIDTQSDPEAERQLRAVADELAQNGVRTRTQVRVGEPADEVVAATRALNADLIVMATHGRSGLQRAFSGSVTERVLGLSPVPVLVLKPGGKRMEKLQKLLVAVDGTVGGALAVGSAAALARIAHARLVLVQVVPPLPTWMFGGIEGYAPAEFIDPAWEDASVESATSYVQTLASRLAASGIDAEGQSLKGPVAQSIEKVADEQDVDLIVMSTHALTGPARAVLGSVADEVVRTSGRPVLLVRRPGGVYDATAPAEAALLA